MTDKTEAMDLAKTLDELSARWGEIHSYRSALQGGVDRSLADNTRSHISHLADMIRTGKLIVVPDDAVDRMARALAVADAKDGCKSLLIESESYMDHARKLATAALATLKGAGHAG